MSEKENSVQINLESAVEQNREVFEGGREIVDVFEGSGLSLSDELKEALRYEWNDIGTHYRLGNGYDRALVVLSRFINKPRSALDLSLLDSQAVYDLGADDLYGNDESPNAYAEVQEKIKRTGIEDKVKACKTEEAKILGQLMCDILLSTNNKIQDKNFVSTTKVKDGACTTAEIFYLDWVNGAVIYKDNYWKQTGKMSIVEDNVKKPLLVTKMGLGVPKSCLTLQELSINGVTIPVGSIVIADYEWEDNGSGYEKTASGKGKIIPVSEIKGLSFVRLSTMGVSSENRRRAFGKHVDYQVRHGFPNPETTKMSDFIQQAKQELSKDNASN